MTLLNICIPTYNRSAELRALAETFLSPVLVAFGNRVSVHIFDNSDVSHAAKNSELATIGISYHKNEHNIGFSGNILRCLGQAGAEYVWIISDNDTPNLENFSHMLKAVGQASDAGVNAVMLPFTLAVNGVEVGLRNSAPLLGMPPTGRFADYAFHLQRLPFVLFSAVILRTKDVDVQAVLSSIGSRFSGNDYIQIPLFWSVIGDAGTYAFFDKTALRYEEEYESRFRFPVLVGALNHILQWTPLEASHKRRLGNAHFREWCLWLVKHRAGRRRVRDPKALYWTLCREFPRHRSIKNLAALVLPLFPRVVAERFLGPE